MPPNIGGALLSLSITLTPIRGSGDNIRNITLKPGQPCLIGRASKSSLKNLEPRDDNALYDCPVISREHAELRAHLWDMVENQVTIIDKGSMHGTRVNGTKLSEGEPKTLRSGDIIQFGEKVTRGDSTHEGVFVTFSHRHNFTQDSNTFAATNPSGVYRYPYSDEESDYESDDRMSVMSDKEEIAEVSSAKTTPEQAKAKLGTQEQPIDLDLAEKPKRTMVQDSVAPQASILIEDSIPTASRKANVVDVDSDDEDVMIDLEEEGIGSDNENSVADRDDNPTTTLSGARAMSYASLDEDADEQEGLDYPESEGADDISDSDASDLNHFSQLDEVEAEEDDLDDVTAPRLFSPILPKEPSPELRSSGQCRSSPAPGDPSNKHSQSSARTIFPKSPATYGQSSIPAPGMQPTFHTGASTYSSMHDGSAYRPFAFGSQLNFTQPAPPTYRPSQDTRAGATSSFLPRASRWDQPPAFSRVEPMHSFSNPYVTDTHFAAPTYPPLTDIWNDAPVPYDHGFASSSSIDQRHYSPQSPKLPPLAPANMSRISIPDIVENSHKEHGNFSGAFGEQGAGTGATSNTETTAMMHEARDMVGKARKDTIMAVTTPLLSVGIKRKANDMQAPAESEDVNTEAMTGLDEAAEERSDIEASAPASKKVKVSDNTTAAIIESPQPAARSTLASAGSFAAGVAKYTGVAAAGGAGMLAFLCSPASEKLLTWLS